MHVKEEPVDVPDDEAEEGAGQKRKRQQQRSQAGKGRGEAAAGEAGAEFAPFAVSVRHRSRHGY